MKTKKKSQPVAAAIGSALACKIADALLTDWQDRPASRLQLRGPTKG